MKALLVSLFFASTASAQLPYVEIYGQRKDVLPCVKTSGVYWPEKRITITVFHYPGNLMGTYAQPYDFPLPSTDRSIGRVWYPIQIDRWTDGRPWIRRWAYVGYFSTEYRLIYDDFAK